MVKLIAVYWNTNFIRAAGEKIGIRNNRLVSFNKKELLIFILLLAEFEWFLTKNFLVTYNW